MVLTAPLDIPTSSLSSFPTCTETCSYTFDYGTSTTVVEHVDNYFKFTYESSNSIRATYNNTQLQVQDIRLYWGSLTAYNGGERYLELLVHHIDTQGKGLNVMVSVPIKVEESPPQSNALRFFEGILPHLPTRQSDPVPINQSFSLNDLIPYQPFVTAQTTLPYPPNNGEYTSIYFLSTNTVPVISQDVFNKLTRLLVASGDVSRTKPEPSELYYSPVGSSHPDSSTADDDIWIDCQPTGDSLIPEDDLAREAGDPRVQSIQEKTTEFLDKYGWYFYSFFSIIMIFMLFYLIKKFVLPMVSQGSGSSGSSRSSGSSSAGQEVEMTTRGSSS